MPTRVEFVVESNDGDEIRRKLEANVFGGEKILGLKIRRVEAVDSLEQDSDNVLFRKIETLTIPSRSCRALRSAHLNNGHGSPERREDCDIKTIGDLVGKTSFELLEYFDFGCKGLEHVRHALQTYGLSLHGE